jgi:hypothetical protein
MRFVSFFGLFLFIFLFPFPLFYPSTFYCSSRHACQTETAPSTSLRLFNCWSQIADRQTDRQTDRTGFRSAYFSPFHLPNSASDFDLHRRQDPGFYGARDGAENRPT